MSKVNNITISLSNTAAYFIYTKKYFLLSFRHECRVDCNAIKLSADRHRSIEARKRFISSGFTPRRAE